MFAKNSPIYLDYGATTPLDERVWEAMLPYFQQQFGNPASVHQFGQQAEFALENARRSLAERLGAHPDQIIFTSGATESDNLALRGTAFAERSKRNANHILVSSVEHDAIANTARQLAELHGFEVERIPVDKFGQVQPESLSARLREDTAVVSIIMASNEVGTVNPIRNLAAICRDSGVPLHSDAVQAAAYLPIDVQELGVDMLSLGAHKFYGPKGMGLLYLRDHNLLSPIQTGGSHEFQLRAGTQNTPYIVGMAKAYELLYDEIIDRHAKLAILRDQVIEGVLASISEAQLSGHPNERLPNHASFIFRGIDGNALLMHLDQGGFACSSGSACKTGNPEPSEVLLALGLQREWALGSLRVTVGIHTSREDIERFLEFLPQAIEKSRVTEITA